MEKGEERIVFFDGVCNLCNGAIIKLIQMDKKNILKFASLQSDVANFYIPESAESIHSVVFYDRGIKYTKSTAVLHILKTLGGVWKLTYAFIIIPAFIRDAVYDFIASHRYKWFGKKDQCMVPTKELKARFL